MPPAKLDACVDELMAKGKSQASAFAICTAQLQNAGVLRKGTRKLARGKKSKGKGKEKKR